ncbi:MAG: biotin/lipoyl-binding protein [Chloracidobacterium sp.]|uniref:Biotin/lipoyl-binding protein n=1 Tax=Chloracidobacterium validum TaxID=2821543 RepID=A0ABX8BBH1_9BACT|nr:biotin/lipoyl-binding protein [Chloracidobacterium validum]QUW04283.1 biotin/lipoyl-binding protein [Chloracidobacterium validum]
MKLQSLTLPLITIAALSYAGYSTYVSQPVRKPEPPPAAPPRAPYAQGVAGVGLVEAGGENIALNTPVAGLVTRVFVRAGDDVKRGDRLFELDSRDLQAELALRRQTLDVARARLARLEQAPWSADRPMLEAKVLETEAQLADADMQLKRIENVSDQRAVRAEEVEHRRFAVLAARARHQEAKAQLARLDAGTWKADLDVARSEVKLAQANVKRIEADIERLTVRALTAGKVLQCNVRPGEYAQAGQLAKPLITLGNADELHVRVDIDENEAPKVKPSARAVGYMRGKSEVAIPLEFVRYEPLVVPKKSLTGDATERVDTRVLQVIYRVATNDAALFIGQQMDVYIDQGGQP